MPECSLIPKSYSLYPYFLYVASIPTYFLNFNFLIILVCLLLYILSILLSVHALSYSVIIINQSIHINLSAGAQNITGAHIIIMLVCRRLL